MMQMSLLSILQLKVLSTIHASDDADVFIVNTTVKSTVNNTCLR